MLWRKPLQPLVIEITTYRAGEDLQWVVISLNDWNKIQQELRKYTKVNNKWESRTGSDFGRG